VEVAAMMQVDRIPLPLDPQGRMDEAAWHALRAVDLTASDVGAVMQVGQRSTALSVYLKKAGLAAPDQGTKYTRRGHILEPVVAAELETEWTGCAVIKADVYLRGRDPDDPHLRIGATKDYDVVTPTERWVLEIKTVAPMWFRRWWRHGRAIRPPLDNLLQLRTQMMLDDSDAGVLACLVCDDAADIHKFRVERVARAEDAIRRRVSAFWRAFDEGRLPPMEYGREAANLDRLRKAKSTTPPMVDHPDLAELADRYTLRAREAREAAEELRELSDRIREITQGHPAVLLPDARRVTITARNIKVTTCHP
jgi:predicted phage-related endonuclease